MGQKDIINLRPRDTNLLDHHELQINKLTFILFLIVLFLSIFSLTNVKAKTQSTDLNNSIFADCGGTRSYNKYCDFKASRSPQYATRSLNTTISGTTDQLSFGFQRQMSAYAQYIVNVYAMSTDFRNNDLSVVVYGSNVENSINNVMNNATYSFVSKNQIQVVIPENNYTYHYIVITGDSLTGVNSYGVKKITLSWDDGATDMSGVISNQTQNTQDIINNANSNTEEVTNKITETFNQLVDNGLQANNNERKILSNMCKNNYYTPIGINKGLNGSGDLIDMSGSFYMTDYVAIDKINDSSLGGNANYLYINEPTRSTSGYYFMFYDSSFNYITATYTATRSVSIPNNAVWFRFNSTSANTTIFRYSDKCIEASDQVYGAITNDNIDSGTGSDFFNGFTTTDNGGISSIVTKPLVLINSFLSNNDSCSNLTFDISIPNTQTTHVSLPSGCILWNNVPSATITIYQTIICGFASYLLVKKLFKDIEDLKNPDDDRVKTEDL